MKEKLKFDWVELINPFEKEEMLQKMNKPGVVFNITLPNDFEDQTKFIEW